MSFTGNLKTVAFPDILQLVSTGKKTGMLHITRGTQKKEVYFRGGNIIFATSSNIEDDFLGNLLVKRGKISKADLERAVNLQRVTGKKIGVVMMEMKLFGKEELLECLKIQIEEIVYNLFGWDAGEFCFYDGKTPAKDQVITELNTMNVIMEGTRRIDEWIEIQKALPADNNTLRIVPHPKVRLDEIRLTLEEFAVLNLINGERTVPDIIKDSTYGEFVTSKALFKLVTQGLVEVSGTKEIKKQIYREDELLINLIARVFYTSYKVVERALERKLGRIHYRISHRAFGQAKAIFPLLSGLAGSNGNLNFENFVGHAFKLPKELRLHKMLEALSGLLEKYLRHTFAVLGKNITRKIISEIKREIAPSLLEQAEIARKYDVEGEVFKTFKQLS